MKLHHVGKVVRDLQEAKQYYSEIFGLCSIGAPVIDPIQKVEVVFIDVGFGHDFTIELIRPLSKDSPVNKFLEKGGGMHHLCFEVEDIRKSAEELRKKGALILGNPVPGKGHNDRLTLWLFTSQKELVELVECAKK